jgi:hypothetical protein
MKSGITFWLSSIGFCRSIENVDLRGNTYLVNVARRPSLGSRDSIIG